MAHAVQSTQWWQALDRRTFGQGAFAFAALAAMSGCQGEEEVAGDSLDLQRRNGWNLGAEERRLFFRNTSSTDATGSTDWKRYADPNRLIEAWRPRSRAWEPYMVPTLMQALESASLRQQIRPIFSPAMERAFKRGEVLRKDLLSQVTKGPETFFIADLPGPEAVALSAGLAGWADVIPAFDNWPHPSGVVPSHETLAAMIYYAAYVNEEKKQVPEPSPGLLLLDARRLSPYKDGDAQFDNRYLANVPLQDALQSQRVSNVLYMVPNRNQKNEGDDLNDEFVEYRDNKIQVSVFPLSDMEEVQERVAEKQPDGSTRTVVHRNYYYGGGFGSHLGFLMLYSFLAPRPFAFYNYPYGGGRRVTFNDTRPTRRPPNYTPRPRPTQFSGSRVGGGRGVGRTKPTGFGRTTVRSRGGRVTSVRGGSRSGRSGSFGRGGFSTGA